MAVRRNWVETTICCPVVSSPPAKRLDRVEIRRIFKLHDIRKTRVWQEAHEEGIEQGIEKGIEKGIEQGIEKGIEQGIEKGIEKGRALEKRQLVQRLQANGQTLKEIAQLLGISVTEVRRMAGR